MAALLARRKKKVFSPQLNCPLLQRKVMNRRSTVGGHSVPTRPTLPEVKQITIKMSIAACPVNLGSICHFRRIRRSSHSPKSDYGAPTTLPPIYRPSLCIDRPTTGGWILVCCWIYGPDELLAGWRHNFSQQPKVGELTFDSI